MKEENYWEQVNSFLNLVIRHKYKLKAQISFLFLINSLKDQVNRRIWLIKDKIPKN